MPPSYTITSGDVSSVSVNSKLVAGTIFDWGNQTITIPNTVAVVDAQWLVDATKFVEFTFVGNARSFIISANGKYKKGVDPATGLDILAGVETILLEGWILVTAKTSGGFLAKDIFKTDGSYPIAPNPLVNLQYQTAQGVSLVQLASGGGGSGASAADVWNYGNRSLTDKADFSLSSGGILAIWQTLTASLTTVGSVGKRIADFLNASVVAIPTTDNTSDIAAIKATVEDLSDIAGYTEGQPAAVDATAGTITANGKTVTVTQPTPTTKVITRGP